MQQTQYVPSFTIGGVNTYLNPMLQNGQLIHAVNVDSSPYGGKIKRPGYSTFLNAADGSAVNNLFPWTKNDGSTSFLYRASGSVLQYYDINAGTATSWVTCGNGTIGAGAHVGYAVLNNTLIIGDGIGSTRHTTDGTSFTNTTGAPVGEFLSEYLGRVFIGGTASTLFYSSALDGTNWSLSGTSDSSSLTVPDAGKLGRLFKLDNRLFITKNSGKMFKWDGFTLSDMATDSGPSSPYSYSSMEDTGFWMNRLGMYASNGGQPELISNAIQREIYNDANTGIAGTAFNTLPAGAHQYNNYVSVGTVSDSFTQETIANAIIKYDYLKNEFLNYSFANKPTAFASYKDNTGVQRMVFGDTIGQCYTFGGTVTADNGVAIDSHMEYIYNFNSPHLDKDWRWITLFFNPGCQAQVQVACTDTFSRAEKRWIDLGSVKQGAIDFRFPSKARSKLLYLRIKESSKAARYNYYGCAIGALIVDKG